jgi:hypothetical protein
MDRAYTTVREHEHVIAGQNVSMVVVHDAFQPLDNWKYWFTESKGSEWINYGLDTHIYHAWPPAADYDNYGHIISACGMKDSLAAAQEWIPTVSQTDATWEDYTHSVLPTLSSSENSLLESALSVWTTRNASTSLRQI